MVENRALTALCIQSLKTIEAQWIGNTMLRRIVAWERRRGRLIYRWERVITDVFRTVIAAGTIAKERHQFCKEIWAATSRAGCSSETVDSLATWKTIIYNHAFNCSVSCCLKMSACARACVRAHVHLLTNVCPAHVNVQGSMNHEQNSRQLI